MFLLASCVCKSLQCLNFTLTQGGKGGHLFRLTCSVVLWGGCKQISLTCVRSARSVQTTLGLPQLTAACAFPAYTAQAPGCSAGHCPKWTLCFMYFPGLSCSGSGSWVFHKGTDSVGPAFCGLPRSRSSGDQVLGESTVPGVWCILSPPCSQLLGFLGAQQECCLRCAVCRLWGADLRLRPSWQMSTVQDPRNLT